MAKILIPTPLRQYAGKHDSVELEGGTVGEVLTELTSKFPDLRKQLFTDQGKLRSFVNVYLNDEDIRYLEKEATRVAASDTVSIVPSIAGGATQAAPTQAAPTGEPITPPSLSNDEVLRYSRHLIMP
ncbi:MAG TPA: ubiquitin-like small modifier protein 1, partial [Bryobacteraceae bacterium]|nr:ubiquitin-like small modifier protein 1 [Bryobacteraceae bacterium]